MSQLNHQGPLTALALVLLSAFGAAPAPATTLTVGQDGASRFSVIQDAIDAATHGDEIIVNIGTYIENIHFHGKNIILRSTAPGTTIDGNSSGSVVTFAGTEDATCVLSGFRIINGSGTIGDWNYTYGGGILGNTTFATIQRNRIENSTAERGGGLSGCNGVIQQNSISLNEATWYGGGLYACNGAIHDNLIQNNTAYAGGGLSQCNGLIQNNTIADNAVELGGGGGLHSCDGMILDNAIVENSAWHDGGGLKWCDATIRNNRIESNLAGEDGGGLYNCNGTIQNNVISWNVSRRRGGGLRGCFGEIQNNTIIDNSAEWTGGAIYVCETIQNCIIWGNTAPQVDNLEWSALPTYSCIEDWTGGGEGNISENPMFADDDFRLQPESPCIDTGGTVSLAVDLDGNPRPMDGDGLGAGGTGDKSDFDMGAYEFIGATTECLSLWGCFVEWQYADFLNREAEPRGYEYYAAWLCSGRMTPEQTVANFLDRACA